MRSETSNKAADVAKHKTSNGSPAPVTPVITEGSATTGEDTAGNVTAHTEAREHKEPDGGVVAHTEAPTTMPEKSIFVLRVEYVEAMALSRAAAKMAALAEGRLAQRIRKHNNKPFPINLGDGERLYTGRCRKKKDPALAENLFLGEYDPAATPEVEHGEY
jgi:hypothetical protein